MVTGSLVFLEDTDTVYGIPEYDYMPRPRDTMKTVALVYDISNRKNPEEDSELQHQWQLFPVKDDRGLCIFHCKRLCLLLQ